MTEIQALRLLFIDALEPLLRGENGVRSNSRRLYGTRKPIPEPPPRSTPDALHVRPNLTSAYVAPETDTQRLMLGIWTESLGISDIGIDDNFFALGPLAPRHRGSFPRAEDVRRNHFVTGDFRGTHNSVAVRASGDASLGHVSADGVAP